jgi:hypothetical protein
MLGNLRTVDRWLLTRRCVRCGYDGAMLNRRPEPRASAIHVMPRCPRCGCDLTQRPPRSYAEMEGLLGMPAEAEDDEEIVEQQQRGERLVHRWLAVLFIAMLGLLAIAYLSAAAVGV